MTEANDWTGRVIDGSVVLRPASNGRMWFARCVCGESFEASANRLSVSFKGSAKSKLRCHACNQKAAEEQSSNRGGVGSVRSVSPQSKIVKVGQTWSFETPAGDRRTFVVTHLQLGPGGRRMARGKDESGRKIMCPLVRLERGEYDSRLDKDVAA